MDAATAQANRDAAAALIRQQLGLPSAPSDWTYDQRNQYNKALAAYIAANPDQFTQQDQVTAHYVSTENYQALQDTSFDTSAFIADAFKPLGDAAQAVGNGVFGTLNLVKYLPWIAGAVVVGWLGIKLYEANKKAGSPIKLPGAS